jgi:uncharacterized repeat protein (TIGR01451 family)
LTFGFTANHNNGSLNHNFSLPTGLLTTNPAVSFTNPVSITIPDNGSGAPYPSVITVAGVTDPVVTTTVTLTNITHTFPDDIDVLLVGPGGQNVLLMSDVGGGSNISGVTLTFADTGEPLPDNGPLTSGTFAPTNIDTNETFAGPAPAGPYGEALSVFAGVEPNGTWRLYVTDDAGGDLGNISGGWSLALTTAKSLCGTLAANLAVVKSVQPNPIVSGAPLTYTLTASNAGPNPAASVVVTDKLPAALTFGGVSGPGWNCTQAGGVVTCTRPQLAAGTASNIIIKATAPITPRVLTNTASITATTFDPQTANNTVTISTTMSGSVFYLPLILK